MRYSLVTEEGKQLAQGEPEAIREFLNDRRGDAMVRMANQSIFADMLQASLWAVKAAALHVVCGVLPTATHQVADGFMGKGIYIFFPMWFGFRGGDPRELETGESMTLLFLCTKIARLEAEALSVMGARRL